VPFTVLVYPHQLTSPLNVGQKVHVVGLHAELEPGPFGAPGPLRLGLRCEQIGAVR
jgi:hypothetical protein